MENFRLSYPDLFQKILKNLKVEYFFWTIWILNLIRNTQVDRNETSSNQTSLTSNQNSFHYKWFTFLVTLKWIVLYQISI